MRNGEGRYHCSCFYISQQDTQHVTVKEKGPFLRCPLCQFNYYLCLQILSGFAVFHEGFFYVLRHDSTTSR